MRIKAITRNIRSRARQLGQGMTEYIIITAVIAIAAIAAFTYFGGTVRAQVGSMGAQLGGNAGDMTRVQSESTQAQTTGNRPKNLSNYNADNGAAR